MKILLAALAIALLPSLPALGQGQPQSSVPDPASAEGAATDLPPAPGQVVDVGGHRLHLHCLGTGSPTVVLDAGMGDWSLHLRALQERTAGFARTCTFDRAGYGWSEPGPEPRSSGRIVDELKALLDAVGVEGPYVLAGHSFGGLDVLLFADRYPREVAGVVLIDASHPDQTDRLAAVPEMAAMEAAEMEAFRGLLAAARSGELAPSAVLPMAPASIASDLHETWASLFVRPESLATAAAELEAVQESLEQVREATLGDIPLVVIARGLRMADLVPAEIRERAGLTVEALDAYDALWRELQEDHLGRSTDRRLVVAHESPHQVYAVQPDLVVQEIRELVERVSRRAEDPR